MSKKSDQRKEVKAKHPDWSLSYMADHLSEIADLAVDSETVPQYLKVIALSLHTLALIERHNLMYNPGDSPGTLKAIGRRVDATEAIIQGGEGWGDV